MLALVSENQRQDLRRLIIPIEHAKIFMVVFYTLRQKFPFHSL